MSFLRFAPTVCAIGEDYEILISLKEAGLCLVSAGGNEYYENNSGVLPTERRFLKIRVPQQTLNTEKKYTVVFRKCESRVSYGSHPGEKEYETFDFKPVDKYEKINAMIISDVHYRFAFAVGAAGFFKDDTDFFIINGDIGETETEEHYYEVLNFLAEIGKGKIPMIISRGNHDCRGKHAELYPKFFPSENGKPYYTFTIGHNISGIVIDCGEDKWDSHEEYGGVNAFERYRREETEFIKNAVLKPVKFRFAISHICPVCPIIPLDECGGIFDIERELYEEWNKYLEEKEINCMICGHLHRSFILKHDDERSTVKHSYPVIFGGEPRPDGYAATAITILQDGAVVRWIDQDGEIFSDTKTAFRM